MKANQRPYKILFLCTGNSARSIMAEYLMKRIGQGRFESYSAGSFPTGKVNPFALQVLSKWYHIDASDAYSKSWDIFAEENFDFVITVCDNARETCPAWPGQPIIAHWGLPDPALATGTDEEIFEVFRKTSLMLQRRIELLCALPM
ncbi:MAG: arsenate reductase ArsC, partial [Blastocatellia bacterium]|nr:arsenate reductase ArsC [Blastocatellia bacterium]